VKDFFRKFLGRKLINYYHLVQALLANFVYGFPSRQLHVIGVTGTDGKTTTVNLIASILKAAGLPTSFLSTINAQIGSEVFDTGLHTTTPDPFLLQRLLRQMVRSGSQYAVLEVTSHALEQFRTWGVRFETAVITNVTHEHLDYHKTYDRYLSAKAELFAKVATLPNGAMVLNHDDQSFSQLARFSASKIITYGLTSEADIWADVIEESLSGTKFKMHGRFGEFPVSLKLLGKFNVVNALAAAAACSAYELDIGHILTGLQAVEAVSGRMEFLKTSGGFAVVVDFAHTPNALEALFSFLRPRVTGKIVSVFGVAGRRDASKRPLMGAVADQYADLIVLTREDNRSESVQKICEQVMAGIKHKKQKDNLFVIPDRRAAINFALRRAQRNDLVVVTGKGHEQSLNIDGTEYPWDDRVVAEEELKSLNLS
jgi:UDP-N-acetylmuramoyl-L-alanyl-D-glutamate--2,6-diaminopimelate ligase